jgi:hypothetical protein
MTADQELCHLCRPGDTEPRDIRALSPITMELMQKNKNAGAVGVDDPRRWPQAVAFLLETTSATSVERLMMVSQGSVL